MGKTLLQEKDAQNTTDIEANKEYQKKKRPDSRPASL
jgi:hypothetical protein